MATDLTPEERQLLMDLLTRELSDLGPEIRHTDDRNYRDDLKDRKRMVKLLLDRIQIFQPA